MDDDHDPQHHHHHHHDLTSSSGTDDDDSVACVVAADSYPARDFGANRLPRVAEEDDCAVSDDYARNYGANRLSAGASSARGIFRHETLQNAATTASHETANVALYCSNGSANVDDLQTPVNGCERDAFMQIDGMYMYTNEVVAPYTHATTYIHTSTHIDQGTHVCSDESAISHHGKSDFLSTFDEYTDEQALTLV
jgi:hypothetical protein